MKHLHTMQPRASRNQTIELLAAAVAGLLLLAGLLHSTSFAADDFPWLPAFGQHAQHAKFQDILKRSRTDDLNEALRMLEQLTLDAPEDAVLWEFAGYFHLEKARPWKAVDALRKAVFLQPPGLALDRIGPKLVSLYEELGDIRNAYTIALILREGSRSFRLRHWADTQATKLAEQLQQAQHEPTPAAIHAIHAVPAPGPVTINGRLDDWDLSGAVIACDDVETELMVYSARIAVMYDEQYIYVAIHYRDWSPLGSRMDPKNQPRGGMNGDGVQINLRTADRLSQFDCWYFRARRENIIVRQHRMLDRPAIRLGRHQTYRNKDTELGDGFAQAFREDPNGQGYVQELRVPIRAITNRGLTAQDSFAMLLRLSWGRRRQDKNLITSTIEDNPTHANFWRNPANYGTVMLSPKGNLELDAPAWQQKQSMSLAHRTRFIGHRQAIRDVVFTPDGKELLSAGQDGTVRRWDLRSGQEQLSYEEHDGQVNAVCVTPDNLLGVTAGNDHTIRIWQIQDGTTKRVLKGHQKAVFDLAISADGKHLVSGGLDRQVLVWDLNTGNKLTSLTMPCAVRAVAISPDGQTIAAGGLDNHIYTWTFDGKQQAPMKGHRFGIRDLLFSHDNRHIFSAADDMLIQRWDLATGKSDRRFAGHQSLATSIKLGPDNNLLISSGLDGYVFVWDVETAAILREEQAVTSGIWAVDLAADRRSIAVAARDNILRILQIDNN